MRVRERAEQRRPRHQFSKVNRMRAHGSAFPRIRRSFDKHIIGAARMELKSRMAIPPGRALLPTPRASPSPKPLSSSRGVAFAWSAGGACSVYLQGRPFGCFGQRVSSFRIIPRACRVCPSHDPGAASPARITVRVRLRARVRAWEISSYIHWV